MRVNVYESAVIINAALDDEQIETEVSRLQENIINFGGEILDVDKWGRKRLAYMVNKSKIGYYAIFRFNAQSNIVAKLERSYVLDENIIRFLTIQLDQTALDYFEKNKAASAAIQEIIPEVLAEVPVTETVSIESEKEA